MGVRRKEGEGWPARRASRDHVAMRLWMEAIGWTGGRTAEVETSGGRLLRPCC